ncbi:MAG: MOSC N-terminal beta barrel domain-containing protein [Actinomycetota bacterium]
MPSVLRMNVTPVKSMALAHPDEVELGDVGVAQDRLFYVVDDDGRLLSGARFGPLQTIRPSYDPDREHLRLTFPDGSVAQGDAALFAEGLITDFYGRPVRAHVVPGPWAQALSAFVGRPVRLARCDQPGEGIDVYHVTIVSSASVAELAGKGGHQGDLDAARFRMTFELDGSQAREEDTWAGRRVRVGKALLRIYGPVPRCVVTTQSPETGLKDFESLKTIVSYRALMNDEKGIPFGMYAEVERPGRVRVGDRVEVQG